MIWELRWEEFRWVCFGPKLSVTNSEWRHASNALDWLWQEINRVKGTLYVSAITEKHVLYIRDQSARDEHWGSALEHIDTLLFSGSAKEIVQQLRPYMAMMEGS